MTGWHDGRMAPFDLETTGTNPETARIVQAYAGRVGGGLEPFDICDLLVNPGVPVPAEAAKIHGFTTEYLAEHGDPADAAVHIIASAVADALQEGIPLVGHNIGYDLTVLDRECRRHELPTMEERTGGMVGPVIDTKILSKHVDPYRRRVSKDQGAHQLKTCAQVFQIGWSDGDAHGARFDALVSARVAWRIGAIGAMPKDDRPKFSASRDLFDDVAVDLPDLFAAQKRWAADQDASFAEYFRKQARAAKTADEQIELRQRAESCTGHWPLTPFEPVPAGAIRGAGTTTTT